MPTLHLLRHAKSSRDDLTLPDRERPLAARGRRDAQVLADRLRGLGVRPQLVLCSSSVRTRETLEPLRRAVGDATVVLEDGLYAASCDELLARVRRVDDAVDSVLLIGHNPGLQQLALVLASAGEGLDRLEAKFPTAAVATLALRCGWSAVEAGAAVLAAFVVPQDLR